MILGDVMTVISLPVALPLVSGKGGFAIITSPKFTKITAQRVVSVV